MLTMFDLVLHLHLFKVFVKKSPDFNQDFISFESRSLDVAQRFGQFGLLVPA
ncbi:hypothetical protein B0O79_0295 [Flavobacteriaceae bacterium MAR_2009_75]|nr:hypothetical protein B0O79_0295 [Flavobacteriaceae bacterium MAR_2009_75]